MSAPILLKADLYQLQKDGNCWDALQDITPADIQMTKNNWNMVHLGRELVTPLQGNVSTSTSSSEKSPGPKHKMVIKHPGFCSYFHLLVDNGNFPGILFEPIKRARPKRNIWTTCKVSRNPGTLRTWAACQLDVRFTQGQLGICSLAPQSLQSNRSSTQMTYSALPEWVQAELMTCSIPWQLLPLAEWQPSGLTLLMITTGKTVELDPAGWLSDHGWLLFNVHSTNAALRPHIGCQNVAE